jgi:hypothetical protein
MMISRFRDEFLIRLRKACKYPYKTLKEETMPPGKLLYIITEALLFQKQIGLLVCSMYNFLWRYLLQETSNSQVKELYSSLHRASNNNSYTCQELIFTIKKTICEHLFAESFSS